MERIDVTFGLIGRDNSMIYYKHVAPYSIRRTNGWPFSSHSTRALRTISVVHQRGPILRRGGKIRP
jgi:hypothetical protein